MDIVLEFQLPSGVSCAKNSDFLAKVHYIMHDVSAVLVLRCYVGNAWATKVSAMARGTRPRRFDQQISMIVVGSSMTAQTGKG